MKDLIRRILQFIKIPGRPPAESKCLICGCVESRACPGGCSWMHLDIEGDYGLCTTCATDRLCGLGERLIVGAIEGDPWKPKADCPCPICMGFRTGGKLE
jgi:hypothetical protein